MTILEKCLLKEIRKEEILHLYHKILKDTFPRFEFLKIDALILLYRLAVMQTFTHKLSTITRFHL